MHFSHTPAPAWRLTCRSPRTARTSSNSTSSSAMVRRGQWRAWRAQRKQGWGAPRKLSARHNPPPPLRTREPSVPGTLEQGRAEAELRRLPQLATAPAGRQGRGRRSRGRPGPAPPRRPLLLALFGPLPGVRILGDRLAGPALLSASARGPAGTASSASRAGRLGAGSSDYRGAARTVEGGSPRRRWRQQIGVGDQEAAARQLPPPSPPPPPLPPPPAWGGRGLRGTGSVRGGSHGRRLQLLLRLDRRPAPRAQRLASNLPLRPPRLPNHRPPPLSPSGGGGPEKRPGGGPLSLRAAARVRPANRRAPEMRGQGTRAAGAASARRGWGRVVTPRPESRGRGRGTRSAFLAL